jgi:hypothetical protein
MEGEPASASSTGAAFRAIAEQLERLAEQIRASADSRIAPPGDATADRVEQELERVVAEAKRRLHAEADQVVAATVRVLESAPSGAIAQAEREARERILAATESACQRIEAVDQAQERVARALSQLTPPPPERP